MSGLDEKRKEAEDAVMSASVTLPGTGSEHRTLEEQKRWEEALRKIRADNEEKANSKRSELEAKLKPDVMNFDYIDHPEQLRPDLNREYGVSSNKGHVAIAHTDDPIKMKAAVSLGVMEMMSTSAVPIIQAEGGSIEENIALLSALAAIDYSLEPKSLQIVAARIREHARTQEAPKAARLEALVALSEINAGLHAAQQRSSLPLDGEARRAELLKIIEGQEALQKVLEECEEGFTNPNPKASATVSVLPEPEKKGESKDASSATVPVSTSAKDSKDALASASDASKPDEEAKAKKPEVAPPSLANGSGGPPWAVRSRSASLPSIMSPAPKKNEPSGGSFTPSSH